MIRLAAAEDRAHGVLLKPFAPYLEFAGVDQRWQLFIAPNRLPTRFQIQVHPFAAPPSEWQTVFEEGSRIHTWRSRVLGHARVRSHFEVSSWPQFQALGVSLCRWSARELFLERADMERVRCRNYRQASASPEQARAGRENPGEWLDVADIQRSRE